MEFGAFGKPKAKRPTYEQVINPQLPAFENTLIDGHQMSPVSVCVCVCVCVCASVYKCVSACVMWVFLLGPRSACVCLSERQQCDASEVISNY